MRGLRVFKNRLFAQFARHEKIDDAALCEAIERAERGLIDADLGGGVIKQRIARPNRGRSSGYRSVVLFRAGERAFFVFGFAKNQLENIAHDDLKIYKSTAQFTLALSDEELEQLLKRRELVEVKCDEEDL